MMLNLEPLAALAANEMVIRDAANDSENIITKSLAVLAEQGLYAFGLFLATRKRKQDEKAAGRIDDEVRRLVKACGLCEETRAPDMPTFYRSLTAQQSGESPAEALHRILLTKQLLETTLTYGRYAAKAAKVADAGHG